MTKFLLWIGLVVSPLTFAEEAPDYELRFGPGKLGYSNLNGFYYGADLSIGRALDDNWQWQLGGSYSTRALDPFHRYSVFTGPRYSFGDDFTRAFFVGAGVEWGDQYALGGRDHVAGLAGYVEFGKRFRLNESGSFAYTPFAMMTSRGDGGIIRIEPISFSFSF